MSAAAGTVRQSSWSKAMREPLVVVSLAYITLLVLVAVFAPVLAPADPLAPDVVNRLQPPSGQFWFGTDDLGRDQLSRIMHGTRIALQAAVPTVLGAALVGITFGLVVGYAGGVVDRVFMRIMDVLDAIPLLLLAIAIVAALGRSLTNALLGVAIAFSVTFAKLCRGQVLVEREREYVDSARVLGIGRLKIMFREVLPNVSGPLIIQASVFLGAALLIEAMLSFLGLGAQAGEPSWGRMLDDARAFQAQQPWLAVFPGVAITITVLMFNLLGDGLRDALDVGGTVIKGRRKTRTVAPPQPEPQGGADAAPADDSPADDDALVRVRNLTIEFPGPRDTSSAVVRDVTFDIRQGEVFGLVGESGSGKSMTASSIPRLIPSPGVITGGLVEFDGMSLRDISEKQLDLVRGRRVGMVFQDAMSVLSPVHTIGRQIVDPLRAHLDMTQSEARERAIELLQRVGVPDPANRVDDYPFQFSGGMAQRAVIAIALAAQPDLLIADEPTTALDVTVQEQVLDLLAGLRDEFGMAILFITHDLSVVADICDRVAVMYSGQIVEENDTASLFASPRHPYTAALLEAMPQTHDRQERLATIPGRVPPAWEWPEGCSFAPRCEFAVDDCTARPVLLEGGTRCIRASELQLAGQR